MNAPAPHPQLRIGLLCLALVLLSLAVFAVPAQAAFPGRPGQIVYAHTTSTESGDSGGLFAHGPRLHQPVRRLTDAPTDGYPSFSADGRLIVFSGNHDPGNTLGAHLYVMNADGSGVRQLTSGETFDLNPAFSPDGRKVVFDRAGAGGRPHIFVVDVDGSGLRQLTEGPYKDYDPTFAPSGRWIAFTSNRDHDVRSDRSDIFSMRPDGSGMKVLIDGPRDEAEADISPDGKRIAFVSNRDHGPNVFVADVGGHHVRQLTFSRHDCFSTACYLSPAWAPDGRHIAFLSSGRYGDDLEVMRADGGNRKEFAEGGTEEEGFGTLIGAPTWGIRPR